MSTTQKAYRNILNGLPDDELQRVAVYQTKIKPVPEGREDLLDALSSHYDKNGTIEPMLSFVESYLNSIYKPMFTTTKFSYQDKALVVKRSIHIRDQQNVSFRFTFYWRYPADGKQSFQAEVPGMLDHEKSLFLAYYDWKFNVPSYDSLTDVKWNSFLQMCHHYYQFPAHTYGFQRHVPYEEGEYFFYITVNDYPEAVEVMYEKKKCVQITVPGIGDDDLRGVFDVEEIEHFIEEKAPSRLLFLFE